MQPDGTIRRELRLPEDVFEPVSLESFHGVPVTNDHPPGMITARNARQYAVGSQLGAIVRDEDHVRSRLSVFDGDTIDSMGAGKTQVSCGYTCDTVEQPGVHPLYGPYDAIQKNIRGNHIAIVDRGRAGITAAVRMDGMMVVDADWDESQHPRGEGGKFGEGGGSVKTSPHGESLVRQLESTRGQLTRASSKGQANNVKSAKASINTLAAQLEQEHPGHPAAKEARSHAASIETPAHDPVAHAAGQAIRARQAEQEAGPNPADKLTAGMKAAGATEYAKAMSKQAKGAGYAAQKSAAQAHQTAAAAHRLMGNEAAAKSHDKKAAEHEKSSSPKSPKDVAKQQSGEANKTTRAMGGGGTAAEHAKAAALHTTAKESWHQVEKSARASGDEAKASAASSYAEQHAVKASEHNYSAKALRGSKDHADGMGVASRIVLCKSRSMSIAPTARIELVVRTDSDPDPDDEANRNASGANNARQAPKRQPGQFADKGGDQVETFQDPDDEEDFETDAPDAPFPPKGPPAAAAEGDDDEEPAPPADDDVDPDADPDADPEAGDDVHPFRPGDGSMYDEEGNLTEQATRKIAASSFAVPGKMHLPIHEPRALKNTMKDFGNYPFQASDEKHAAYNRISGKAKQFGINTAGFEKAHAGKLDRIDRKDTMTEEMKALQAKAEKRKEKLVAAKTRIDSLEQDVAKKDGEIASLKKDLETAKAAGRSDSADDVKKVQERIDAKIELLDKARATGAKVESKMSDIEIMRATVKHVDGDDVPADKPEPYVLAMFEGALKRAKKDATDTAKGAAALAATRTAIANPADARSDAADDTDEEAAKSRLKAASYTMWSARPENK